MNDKPVAVAFLMQRCRYAFKTGVGLAPAGQATEAVVMLRSVLEYAAYGLTIFDQPALEEVNCHMSDAGAMKARFNISEVKAVVRRFDQRLADIFDAMFSAQMTSAGAQTRMRRSA